jgi:hypothetical protein
MVLTDFAFCAGFVVNSLLVSQSNHSYSGPGLNAL